MKRGSKKRKGTRTLKERGLSRTKATTVRGGIMKTKHDTAKNAINNVR
jgi:hypothetical protein